MAVLENPLIEETDTTRRDLFSKALAVSSFVALPRASWAYSDATTSSPVRLSASWSATSGLNSLDPSDRNFVSFDPSACKAMKDDPSRTPIFQKALQERLNAAPGGPESQTVLDLGTGPFALFAIMTAEMGAGKVYAIEANSVIAENARKVIQEKGYDDIVTVLDGFSTDVTLPDNEKADIIVAEIVGSIATEEAAYATILDAHKRLITEPNNPQNWIPNRIQTWCAPASYTLHNLFTPPAYDWTKIATEPVRFNCRDLGLVLLDEPQCVEDLSFADIGKVGKTRNTKKLTFTASSDRIEDDTGIFLEEYKRGRLPKGEAAKLAQIAARSCTGVAFWPRLFLPGASEDYVINSRTHPNGGAQRSHWQTVLPIMGATPATGLQGGDTIEVTCDFETPELTSPRYSVTADIFASSRA